MHFFKLPKMGLKKQLHRNAALAVLGTMSIVGTLTLYHQLLVKPGLTTLAEQQQRLVTVDITGLVRERAASLAIKTDGKVVESEVSKIAELQDFNDKIQSAITAFNNANGGNIVVLPIQAVATPIEDITPIIRQIINAQNGENK